MKDSVSISHQPYP